MNKATLKKSLLAVLWVSISFAASSAEHDGSSTCECAAGIKADTSLPLSHPVNRCALKESNNVSWYSWVSGKSLSGQFHYLDLLELLTRSESANQVVDTAESGSLSE